MAQMSQAGDLTSGPMLKKIILFSLPLAASSFLQLLFNAADVVVVGRFAGSAALAAVGSNGALINLLVNLFVGLALGANVVAARCYGAKDDQGVHEAVQTAVTLSLVGGVLMAFVGFFAAHGLLELMSSPEDVIDLATLYLKIYFIGMPMTMLYNFNASLLRAVGDTRRPLVCLAVAGVINVVLNLLFVIVFQMSVAGVALATILSQTVSAIMVTVLLVKEEGAMHLDLWHLGFHKKALLQIIQIGLPAGLQSVMYSLSNIIIQASVNGFGTDVMAAYTAYGKVDGMYWMVINAFGVAITTFVGQNFGARLYDRMKKSINVCLGIAAAVTLLLSGVLMVVAEPLLGLFSDDAQVLEIGLSIVRLIVPTYITYIFIEILSGAMRGAGDSLIPTIMTLTGVCLLRVFWVTVVVSAHHELNVLLLSYPITWIVTSGMFMVYYLRGRWLKRCIALQNAEN